MSKDIPQAVRDEVKERSYGGCEARIPGICAGRAVHVHHRRRRSQGGEHSAENLLDLCTNCHNYAHANPTFGFRTGLLLHAYDEAAIALEDIRYKVSEALSHQRDSAKNRRGGRGEMH